MIIDFHTHVFPDKIAKKTVDYLAVKGGGNPHSDGRIERLLSKLNSSLVDVCVNLPVLTRPDQFESVLNFAIEINKNYSIGRKKIISFAGIHPACDDIKGKLTLVKNAGIKGVKIHPDYQDTYIDDDGYLEILKCAKELDLIVVTHAGIDCAYRNQPAKCPPNLVKQVINKVKGVKFVLAHLGGCEMVGDVIKYLVKEDVYFDTAYVLKYLTKKDFMNVLENHGEDKILFASDFPWSDFDDDVKIIKSYGLSSQAEDKIFYKNAKRLLCLND